MATNEQPIAPSWAVRQAEAAREEAFLFNMDQYLSGKRPLNLCVLALRKAYRDAERTLRGYRV